MDGCNVFGFLINLFTECTVHVCIMFTHLKLRRKWLVDMTIPFLQWDICASYTFWHAISTSFYIFDVLIFYVVSFNWHSTNQRHHLSFYCYWPLLPNKETRKDNNWIIKWHKETCGMRGSNYDCVIFPILNLSLLHQRHII